MFAEEHSLLENNSLLSDLLVTLLVSFRLWPERSAQTVQCNGLKSGVSTICPAIATRQEW